MYVLEVYMNRFCILFLVLLVACVPSPPTSTQTPVAQSPTATSTLPAFPTETFVATPEQTATLEPLVPNFDHIAILIFENKEFGTVIGNPNMPIYNQLAEDYTLLTQFYAVMHPSLPNYIAMIGGDTFGIDRNCEGCFIHASSLPDLIEASGRTWKTYQEDMPAPCYIGSKGQYAQKHNPFVYFDPIRLDSARCEQSIVPLTALQTDIDAGTLPNFIFITPNLCNSAHDCSLDVADVWLGDILTQLVPALDQEGANYLVVLTWDEGQGDHSCCGLPEKAGGRIPVVFISPWVKNNFQDPSPYTHYSLLRTVANSWGLPYLGHAADENHRLILEPWK
jgi:phosphatidylinositol-3-phosphatase